MIVVATINGSIKRASIIDSLFYQDNGPELGDGAANFSDNAPSWEALEALVEKKAQELGWSKPDLEEVWFCAFPAVLKGFPCMRHTNDEYTTFYGCIRARLARWR